MRVNYRKTRHINIALRTLFFTCMVGPWVAGLRHPEHQKWAEFVNIPRNKNLLCLFCEQKTVPSIIYPNIYHSILFGGVFMFFAHEYGDLHKWTQQHKLVTGGQFVGWDSATWLRLECFFCFKPAEFRSWVPYPHMTHDDIVEMESSPQFPAQVTFPVSINGSSPSCAQPRWNEFGHLDAAAAVGCFFWQWQWSSLSIVHVLHYWWSSIFLGWLVNTIIYG